MKFLIGIVLAIFAMVVMYAIGSTIQFHDRNMGLVQSVVLDGRSIVVVSLDHGGAEYVKYEVPQEEVIEEIHYDGGFLGFISLGTFTDNKSYRVYGGKKNFLITCGQIYDGWNECLKPIDRLPEMQADILRRAREIVNKNKTS